MTQAGILFSAAIVAFPATASGAAAWLLGRLFKMTRHRPKLAVGAGVCLGLLVLPFAVVTVGTPGGGYWSLWGFAGGPLFGVIAAVAAACALGTALLFSAGVGVLRALTSARMG